MLRYNPVSTVAQERTNLVALTRVVAVVAFAVVKQAYAQDMGVRFARLAGVSTSAPVWLVYGGLSGPVALSRASWVSVLLG